LKPERDGRSGLWYLVRGPAVAETRRPPLLCFLHGYDEGHPTGVLEGLTRHGPLAPGASRRGQGFVIVAPQLPVQGDYWHRHAAAVRDIVFAASDRHDADPARLYLTGFSYGGNGVFDLASTSHVAWAALWAVDPTRAPREPLTQPVWLSVGEVARAGLRRFIDALQLVPGKSARDGMRVYLDEGKDHVQSATSAYGDARVYDWLLARATAATAT
jgi:poly(3-hydroxybutyrate) depolymerase